MIPPGRVLRIFGTVFLSGVGLGIYYGFLGAPRRKSSTAADLAFLAGLGWCLVLLAFPLCGGDLRPACLGVLVLGFFTARKTLGSLLDPFFGTFWHILAVSCGYLLYPLKKIFRFAKNMFASGEKWVTIR